jgi:hypothetical protein
MNIHIFYDLYNWLIDLRSNMCWTCYLVTIYEYVDVHIVQHSTVKYSRPHDGILYFTASVHVNGGGLV